MKRLKRRHNNISEETAQNTNRQIDLTIFGIMLMALREKRNIDQLEMANKLQISSDIYRKIESGQLPPQGMKFVMKCIKIFELQDNESNQFLEIAGNVRIAFHYDFEKLSHCMVDEERFGNYLLHGDDCSFNTLFIVIQGHTVRPQEFIAKRKSEKLSQNDVARLFDIDLNKIILFENKREVDDQTLKAVRLFMETSHDEWPLVFGKPIKNWIEKNGNKSSGIQ